MRAWERVRKGYGFVSQKTPLCETGPGKAFPARMQGAYIGEREVVK